MKKISLPKTSVAVGLLLALSGCASSGSSFSCGVPGSLTCQSAIEVYEATSSDDYKTRVEPEEARQRRTGYAPGKVAGHRLRADGDSLLLSAPVQQQKGYAHQGPRASAVAMPDGVELVPAQVLRVWVAPWTDASGDLHMPGYVYSEVASRKWSIGAEVGRARTNRFDPNGVFLATDSPVPTAPERGDP